MSLHLVMVGPVFGRQFASLAILGRILEFVLRKGV